MNDTYDTARVRNRGRTAIPLLAAAGIALAFAAPAAAAPSAVPATAAPPAVAASVSVGQLVLDPGERGYQGTLPVTVTNRGTTARSFDVVVLEPVAGSFGRLDPSEPCLYQGVVNGRRLTGCSVPGGELQPGERRSFTVSFHALTTPRPYAMTVGGGYVAIPGPDGELDRDGFNTRFRSTSGSLANPRRYVQDRAPDASIGTAADTVTLTRQPDGTYGGRIRVTVRYGGDAGHDFLYVRAALPEGVWIDGTDPQDSPSFSDWFDVPGYRFMAGEERSFDVLVAAGEETVPGDLGEVTLDLTTKFDADDLVDVDPSDNNLTFGVTAVPAG